MEEQSIQEQKKPNALAFKVAIGFALYTLALVYIFKLVGIDSTSPDMPIVEKVISMILSYGIFILVIFYAQVTHKKELGGFISYGRAFSTGFKVAAYTGLFIGLLFMLYYKVLDTEALDKIINLALEKAGDNEQQIRGVEMMKDKMWLFTSFGAAIFYTIFGLIVSLITAIVVKKEPSL